MSDTWAGVWIEFGQGLRLRKTEIVAYTPWDYTHSRVFLRNDTTEYIVKESTDEIDFLLDRGSVSKKNSEKCEGCLNECECETDL